eukprot:TRINITY_DN8588_c0_g3_i5.p1 TRINITY_DN8588_c0_g3~~TRINITY_DN8588_c0_g3_i5.p1  ORF type:complete len:196 (+),score=44.49 TRINITY_DN8588_c0_g3_i5:102-689(+)
MRPAETVDDFDPLAVWCTASVASLCDEVESGHDERLSQRPTRRVRFADGTVPGRGRVAVASGMAPSSDVVAARVRRFATAQPGEAVAQRSDARSTPMRPLAGSPPPSAKRRRVDPEQQLCNDSSKPSRGCAAGGVVCVGLSGGAGASVAIRSIADDVNAVKRRLERFGSSDPPPPKRRQLRPMYPRGRWCVMASA